MNGKGRLVIPWMNAGTPKHIIGDAATGASRGRGVLTEDGAFRNTLQRRETIQKSPFSFDYLLSKFMLTFHEGFVIVISLFITMRNVSI